MTKITIDLDDSLADRLLAVSRAQNLTVEEWLRAEAEHAARPPETSEFKNFSHRAIPAPLDRPDDYYVSAREEMHDRELGRAEAYASARKALLELVDNTQGDMGAQTWSRGRLYEP